MTAEFARDAAATCAVFGFFASVWFGWAQEAPPTRLRPLLLAGSLLALTMALVGGLLTWQNWSGGTVFDDRTGPRYGIFVAAEFVVALIGMIVLTGRRRRDLVSAWVAVVVGVHLFPLAVILEYPLLHLVGGLLMVAGLLAVPVARVRRVTVSAVTGTVAGAVLLAAAGYSALTMPAI